MLGLHIVACDIWLGNVRGFCF